MARIPAQHRPHYQPTERMAALELRAARGWSLRQTASVFLLSQVTLASWMKRLDETAHGKASAESLCPTTVTVS